MSTPPDNASDKAPASGPAQAPASASDEGPASAPHEGTDDSSDEAPPSDPGEASLAGSASASAKASPAVSLPPPPASVLELADACVRYVERALGVAPDYTPDTLSLLDHYVRSAAPELSTKPEARQLIAAALAAYFGEVLRRHYAASWWHAPGADPAAWQLRFDGVYLALVPFAFAAAALDEGDEGGEEGGMLLDDAEREEIAERLAALPPLEPDEYRLPTTRYDVIEIVVDHLRARAEAQGLGDVRLSDEDYEDA